MILSLTIFFPLVGALLVCMLPKGAPAKIAALAVATIEFVISLGILAGFDATTPALQMAEMYEWIPSLGSSYFVGVDGISLWLVILTTFLTPLILLGAWNTIEKSEKFFLFHMLLLETALIGTFLSMDIVLFYVFFEISLVPMYFIVGMWGGPRRIYATLKFFIYTMLGSLLMLVAIMSLLFMTVDQFGGFNASILQLYKLQIPFVEGGFLNPQTLMFFAFCLAFAIKVPLFPLHTWLPDAHVEAPTPGSVILAGVMLKLGTYGFMRLVLPLFPEATMSWGWLFLALAVIGIVYGALVAMVQPDIKKLVAYSSVSHMGYVVLGIFALNTYGLTGGLYQMLNHGISTGALFLLVGIIYERTHSREIAKYGGLAAEMPIFTIFFFIVTLSSIAVPGTNGFIGEFLILMGAFMLKPVYAYIAVTGVILGAAYMLWMFKRVFFGPAGSIVTDDAEHLKDLSWREISVLTPIVIMIFWMGISPQDFLNKSKASVDYLSNNVSNYELEIKGRSASGEAVETAASNEGAGQ
ncbi:MAG: NADH-quinone oxidoreductase subunit M [Bdellovibrionia bacterium]